MLSFHPLTISDYPAVAPLTSHSPISFHRFTNMFMWRRVMDYRVCMEDGVFYLIDAYRGGMTCAFPPFCPAEKEKEAILKLKEALGTPLTLRPMDEQTADRITSYFEGAVKNECRNEFDYLYDRDALATLPGRKYHAKKNHVNAFLNTEGWAYHHIDAASSEEELDLLKHALSALYFPGQSRDFDEEYEANCDLISHFRLFSLRAGVLTVGGRPVALSVGEQITLDMALVHIEKADRDTRGAFAAINCLFARNAFPHVTFLNREEDMGIEGLRQAKLSYHPVGFHRVFQVEIG